MSIILTPTTNQRNVKSVTLVTQQCQIRLAPGEVMVDLPKEVTVDNLKAQYRRQRVPVFTI